MSIEVVEYIPISREVERQHEVRKVYDILDDIKKLQDEEAECIQRIEELLGEMS